MTGLRGGWSIRIVAALAVGGFLFALPVARQLRTPQGMVWSAPTTPSDQSPGEMAVLWDFLNRARLHVPVESTYTIRARNGTEEHYLLQIAIGLLPDHDLRPASYYGSPTESRGADAEYVLVYGGAPPEERLQLIADLGTGAVYRRRTAFQ